MGQLPSGADVLAEAGAMPADPQAASDAYDRIGRGRR